MSEEIKQRVSFAVSELNLMGVYDTAEQARDAVRRCWNPELHGTAQFPGFLVESSDGEKPLVVWCLDNLDHLGK